MTIMNEVNPPLSEVLEHHGIKGMRWGVRKSPTSKEVRTDFRKSIKLHQQHHKGVTVQRKQHREIINQKKAKSPTYKKEFERRQKRHDFLNSPGVIIGTAVAGILVSSLIRQGSSSYNTVNRGKRFVNSNPKMMNAKLRNGVYTITNL